MTTYTELLIAFLHGLVEEIIGVTTNYVLPLHMFYMVTVKECVPEKSDFFPKGSLLLYLCIFEDFKIRFYSFDTVKRNCLKMNLETLHLYTNFFSNKAAQAENALKLRVSSVQKTN